MSEFLKQFAAATIREVGVPRIDYASGVFVGDHYALIPILDARVPSREFRSFGQDVSQKLNKQGRPGCFVEVLSGGDMLAIRLPLALSQAPKATAGRNKQAVVATLPQAGNSSDGDEFIPL